MTKIDYHGDDYAVSVNNSTRMLELIDSGKLNSISIISNMSYFDECMDMLCDKWNSWDVKPLISVHLNLIDGITLSRDNKTLTHNSWGSLFIRSVIPGSKRSIAKREITEEIKAQILRVYDRLPEKLPLRLDSHVHTHMIPLVFDSMITAVKELNMTSEVEFIRNSKEPTVMFLTTKGIRGTFPVVNLVKNIILNILSLRVSSYIRKHNLPKAMLWGLVMSGNMDSERVKKLSGSMQKKATSKDSHLEILCHPGIVLEQELNDEYGPDDREFMISSNRDIEYMMISSRSPN